MANASMTKGSSFEREISALLNRWILNKKEDEKLLKADQVFSRALGSGGEATVLMTDLEDIRIFKEKYKKELRLINPKIDKEYRELLLKSPEEAEKYKQAVGHLIGHYNEEIYLKLQEMLKEAKKNKRKIKKVELLNSTAVGDIRSVDPRGYEFITKYVIECKNYSKIPWSQLLRNTKGSSNTVLEHWKHLLDTSKAYNRIPFLIYKESGVRNTFPYLFISLKLYENNTSMTPVAIFPAFSEEGIVVLNFKEFLANHSKEDLLNWKN